jgi:hypothetical protein
MPEARLKRAREGYETYVWTSPTHAHKVDGFDMVTLQGLCFCGAWTDMHTNDGVWRTTPRYWVEAPS